MASLTELCSICFTNIPKYTCPRCSCQTCSLACVKTHKKRAACSGVRNPAAYLKSSELATPASIDRDYNFITKAQRDIKKAEDDVADRGITLVPGRSGKNPHAGKSKLEVEYDACGVTVIKAPMGLTRSKQNKTHWDKRHDCVMWTVEWVLQNKQRVHANVQGGRIVLDAFANGVGKKGLQRKRKLDEEDRAEERRPSKTISTWTETTVLQPAADQPAEEQQPNGELATPVEKLEKLEKLEGEEIPSREVTIQLNPVDTIASQIHFYLHRPRTSSKQTCLIPVQPTTSISDMLRNRSILEYPTIYARPEAEDDLPSNFIMEKDYEEQYGIDVVPRLPVVVQDDAVNVLDAITDHIDEKKIMEVLKRDVIE